MTRAERRRLEKSKQKVATYTLTEDQINKIKEDAIKEAMNLSEERLTNIKTEATKEAIDTALILLLTIPMEVLMDHYWVKSYGKKIPEFTDHVLEYYHKWELGELDMDELQKDLWEFGGVRLIKGDDE